MLGRVTIYVDSEVITSFQGELEQWQWKEEFRVPRLGPAQLEMDDAPEPQLVPHKFISLKIVANLHGNYMGIPYLCLFCYNYDNPTEKQQWLDVCMARGQMRSML